ncbi:MAG: glycoside hydrolase family 1 protein [Erysipelotrichaceae bacterium]|nr:glycoside hydrolase family 1 protein [Erysipelotrichaceae bacterium]
MSELKLPENFIWGASICGAQCDGAWKEDGKGENILDHQTVCDSNKTRRFTHEINPDYYYPNHDGNDFYHRYKEDIGYMAELGFKSMRFSVMWTRLYPTGEEELPNPKGLQYYHNIINELKKYDMEPVIMLSHLDFPYHLAMKYGGWSDRRVIDLFLKFCKTVVTEFKGDVKKYIGFNEINILCQPIGSTLGGIIPDHDFDLNIVKIVPQESQEDMNKRFRALHNQFVAAAKLAIMAREIDPEIKIGGCVSGKCIYPLTPNPKDVLAAQQAMQIPDWFVGDMLVKGEYSYFAKRYLERNNIDNGALPEDAQILKKGTIDFYTINYYSSGCISSDDSVAKDCAMNMFISTKNPYLEASEWGWQIDADGLRYLCNEIYGRYGIPIMILENGIGAAEQLNENNTVSDPYRKEYIAKHIQAMKEVIDDGIELLGYYYWAPIDLVSASTGEMMKRYGFVFVDHYDDGSGTMKRYKKESFEWMKKVLHSNGEDLEY